MAKGKKSAAVVTESAPVATVAKAKRPRNSAEVFVKAWHKHGGNAKAIAAELGIKPNAVTVRASQYRTKGTCPLPRATNQGGGARLDSAKLTALVNSLYNPPSVTDEKSETETAAPAAAE